jgi:hypothetical protein
MRTILSTIRWVLIPVLLLVTWGREALAQDPTRLPAVVTVSAPDMPGARRIAGVVRDTLGFPVEGVEITIPNAKRKATSGVDGSFRFDNIAPGTYAVRARKIGYGPQLRAFRVDSAGGVGAFALVPLTHELLPVVTSAARGGLSGVVGDTSYRALPNTRVKVLGQGEWDYTDSVGGFFIPVRPGTYTVAFQRDSFADRVVSVIVPEDSGRHITVTLKPPSAPRTIRQVWNLEDFSSRLAWRNNTKSTYYTRAELEQKKIEWVYDAVRMGAARVGGIEVDTDCAVVVDGGPHIAVLKSLTVDEIEAVEIYVGPQGPPAMPPRPGRGGKIADSRAPAANMVVLSNTLEATHANMTRRCPIVYVWRR